MKTVFAIIILILFLANCNNSPKRSNSQNERMGVVPEPDKDIRLEYEAKQKLKSNAHGPKYIFEFNESVQQSWSKIEREWHSKSYNQFIKQHEIVVSDCYTCGELYLDVDFFIDKNGKCTYIIYKTSNCRKPLSKKFQTQLMQFFKNYVFPETMRNITFQQRLGDLLKC